MTADPQGGIISRANDAEQLIFTDLDPALVETTRRLFPVESDRKDALYHTLSNF
jgi:predicted amidohydrolase